MLKIKIGYFADGPWSHFAFEKLISDPSIEIVFIVPRTDSKDTVLLEFSKKYGIDYLFPVNINSDSFYFQVQKYKCDLFVSMSFNQIFTKKIFSLPKFETINCHAGKLPFYRGRNILNWALINDEKDFGITVHYIDEGIDTGDIILQRTYEITESDSYNTLLSRAYVYCSEILYDSIKMIQNRNAPRIKQNQIHPIGFYVGRRNKGDEIIDWNQTSREIFNFIRSINLPGPQAITFLSNGIEIKINKATLIENAPIYKSTIGQILKKDTDKFWVKTKDSFIEISELTFEGKLNVGDKFIKNYAESNYNS